MLSTATRVLTALFVTAVLLGLGSPASAHTSLVSSDPAEGASVAALPQTVTLTFSEDIQPLGTTGELAGPDGAVTAEVAASGPQLVATLPAEAYARAGDYTFTYRVTSADGHPVSGRVAFTTQQDLGAPPSATASPAPSEPVLGVPTESSTTLNEPAPSAEASDDGGNSAVWIGVGVLALIAVVAGGFLWRRRSKG